MVELNFLLFEHFQEDSDRYKPRQIQHFRIFTLERRRGRRGEVAKNLKENTAKQVISALEGGLTPPKPTPGSATDLGK